MTLCVKWKADAQKYAEVHQNPTFCQQECMEIFMTHFVPERYQYNGSQTNWLIIQMFRASDMVWINQWSIPEPDSYYWQWNQGTSCYIRDKVQDRKLCIRIIAKGTLLVGFQSRNVNKCGSSLHHTGQNQKLFQERGWGSPSFCLMTMWHPTWFRAGTFGMPSFRASENL